MSTIAPPPEQEHSAGYVAALLELAELDRQIGYLEAEVTRSRLRHLVMIAWCALGWVLLVITNWRSLCHLAGLLVGLVGRTLGGLF